MIKRRQGITMQALHCNDAGRVGHYMLLFVISHDRTFVMRFSLQRRNFLLCMAENAAPRHFIMRQKR